MLRASGFSPPADELFNVYGAVAIHDLSRIVNLSV